MLPCVKYSFPSGPKAIWLVVWSRIERGRFLTTSVTVASAGPVSLLILPVQSGAPVSA
jgi:hypothetical protein